MPLEDNLNFWSFAVPPHHRKGLLEWAFGTTQPIDDFSEIWNRRHGSLFKIKPKDTSPATLHKIGQAYIKWYYGDLEKIVSKIRIESNEGKVA